MGSLADHLRIIMEHEGDGEDFFHAGLPCSVWRSSNGAWAGYVAVPRGHPLHGENAVMHPDLDVHGGVTFANLRADRGALWWVGFDCWHLHDIKPLRLDGEFPDPFSSYKSKSYAVIETRSLAEQLSAMELDDE